MTRGARSRWFRVSALLRPRGPCRVAAAVAAVRDLGPRGVDWRAVPYFQWDLFLVNNGHLNLVTMLVVYAGAIYLAYR